MNTSSAFGSSMYMYSLLLSGTVSKKCIAVGAASQWWSNKRMMVYFKLKIVRCSLMMVKWMYDHIIISPSLPSISPSLTIILPSLAWGKPSFADLTIIEKLHRLYCLKLIKLGWTEIEYWLEFIHHFRQKPFHYKPQK